MKRFFILILIICFTQSVQATEQIPVKITPAQVISTHNDELEVGDYIKFKVVNDVYYKDKLYIEKGSIIVGMVASLHENGYFCDNTEILLTPFKVKNIYNTVITIDSEITINRKDYTCKTFGDKIVKYVGVVFRGNEIKIEPGTIEYNLFLVK